MENHPRLWLALNHHRTHNNKPITLDKHHYLVSIYTDNSDHICIMKSTQCGISEYLIVYTIDKSMKGLNIFYALPDLPVMRRFVLNRFNKSMAYTPFYRKLQKPSAIDEADKTESISLKDIGKGTIAFVGSQTPSPFTEFPADVKIVDEKDRCDPDNLAMGDERLSHSDYQIKVDVSNPTVEEYGIHEDFLNSDQKLWYIRCSRCGKWIQPDFFTHIVRQVDENNWIIRDKDWSAELLRDIYPVCEYCNRAFDRFNRGEWLDTATGKISGYSINKLFSSNVTMTYMIDRFNAGLSNSGKMQRFYNGDLGRPLTASGMKLNETLLDECRDKYLISIVNGYLHFTDRDVIVSGIDVGAQLHVTIWKITADLGMQALYIGTVTNPEDYIQLHARFKVKVGVIDANPETRMAKKIVATLKGMFLCYYGQVKADVVNGHNKSITVDRTQTLDAVQEFVILKKLILPINIRSIEGYYKQMTKSTRVYDEKKEKYEWTKTEDHYFHSTGYALLAKKLAAMLLSQFT